MKKNTELMANGQAVRMMKINGADFICLTDIARFKNPEFPADVVRNWMRSKMTVAFLGLWEQLHNPDFNMVEFDQFKNEAGTNSFVLPPQVWIERTGAIGIMSKSGRYGGGTFAHHDIAFEFASRVSVEFKLHLIHTEASSEPVRRSGGRRGRVPAHAHLAMSCFSPESTPLIAFKELAV